MRLRMKWLLVFLVFCGGAGCVPTGGGGGGGRMGDLPPGDDGAVGGISEVPNPTPEMARQTGTPMSVLERGHVVYMLKCGECHMYQLPEHLDIEDWEYAVPEMIGHAGLPRSDEQAVLSYVKAVKKQKG